MACIDVLGGYDKERFENEVDCRLICPICRNVLKDPVRCPNEDHCCRLCIGKRLQEVSETCPTCQCHLTEETLGKPTKYLREDLSRLKIRCDHERRGCLEFIKLELLDRHVKTCGYSPTRCINDGCEQVINQRDKERHENELCPFRKIVCDECEQEVIWQSRRVHVCFMRKEIDDLTKDMNNMKEEIAFVKKEGTERCDLFTGRQKIFVCGGNDGKTELKSTESYNWPDNAWTLEPAMNEERSRLSAFVHEQQIFATGGWDGYKTTDSIESFNVGEEDVEWIQLPVNMPLKSRGHRIVYHENGAILTGGYDGENASDGIYEISLTPPHETKLLTRMPEPRCYHGCQIIDNKVVIAGGRTSKYFNDATNTVYLYDINNNECKPVAPLPFAICDMATVSYKGNVILIGGVNEKAQTLNSVMMYDIKTGNIEMLPNLKHKRSACAAVITGNVILVMGGYDHETKTRLDSVEYLDLKTNAWKELSPMTTKRSGAAAVLKPII